MAKIMTLDHFLIFLFLVHIRLILAISKASPSQILKFNKSYIIILFISPYLLVNFNISNIDEFDLGYQPMYDLSLLEYYSITQIEEILSNICVLFLGFSFLFSEHVIRLCISNGYDYKQMVYVPTIAVSTYFVINSVFTVIISSLIEYFYNMI